MWRFHSGPRSLTLSPAVKFPSPYFQLHHDIHTSSKTISDFFPAWNLFKASKEPFFPLFQCEALKYFTIPVLGGSLCSSLIWLSSLPDRACIEHNFLTLSERSFTAHFFTLSGASGSSCSYIKKGTVCFCL